MRRVVVVDDHPVFRRGVVATLRAAGIEVVAEARGGLEAVAVVAEDPPDVVLMDLAMPDGDGFEATARITAEHPEVRVVVVSLFDDERSVARALAAGACGYVGKHADAAEIVAAIEAAAGGALLIGAGVGRPDFSAPEESALAGLTPREVVIADLLSRGLANPAIGARLNLSTKTVANYVSSIVLKLGADDRQHAARIVRESAGR